ncbi:MAG TPA: response regulator [Polyangiaceae bacterium]|jgi:CheY-like chemotaxis protein
MSSVALASRLHSAQSDDSCSDLNQVVARVEQSIARVAGHYVGVQFSLSPNVARVAVPVAELERVVLGLCAGASSMLSSGGRLVVETRGINDAPLLPESAPDSATQAHARVIVRAERLGAPADRAVALAYSQLAIADLQELLARLGGELELVQSDQELAFVAHLPYALASNSSGRMAIAVAHAAGAILLVEDEPQVQAVTARILRAFGYSVITAHNERTALAQAEQHGASIGLVVSDLVLPGVSGKDLVRRLRKPCEHAQVLYISGYSPDHVGTLADGACFLRKPFTAQELLAMVRELMPAAPG